MISVHVHKNAVSVLSSGSGYLFPVHLSLSYNYFPIITQFKFVKALKFQKSKPSPNRVEPLTHYHSVPTFNHPEKEGF